MRASYFKGRRKRGEGGEEGSLDSFLKKGGERRDGTEELREDVYRALLIALRSQSWGGGRGKRGGKKLRVCAGRGGGGGGGGGGEERRKRRRKTRCGVQMAQTLHISDVIVPSSLFRGEKKGGGRGGGRKSHTPFCLLVPKKEGGGGERPGCAPRLFLAKKKKKKKQRGYPRPPPFPLGKGKGREEGEPLVRAPSFSKKKRRKGKRGRRRGCEENGKKPFFSPFLLKKESKKREKGKDGRGGRKTADV